MHGREHRAFNDRLDRARLPDQALRAAHQVGPRASASGSRRPTSNLAATAALEHFTATLAELSSSSEETRRPVRPRRGAQPVPLARPRGVRAQGRRLRRLQGRRRQRAHAGVDDERPHASASSSAWRSRSSSRCSRDRDDLPAAARLRASWRRFRRSPIMQPRAVGPAARLQPPRLPPRRPRHRPSSSSAGARELFGDDGHAQRQARRRRGRVSGPTTVEHLDVLDRRRRPVRHRRRPPPADRVPVGQLRHLRGPRRHRRHVGPVPLPRHPVRLRHVHARLLVPPVGRREVDRRRRRRSCSTSRTPRAEAGIDEHIRFHHRIVARRLVDRRRPLARHRRAHRHRRDGRAHRAASSSRAAATTATTRATCPTSPACDRFRGTIVHPQAWPEDLDYAGKRVVVIGSGATAVTLIPSMAETAGARHDAPALAQLHRLAARPRTRSPTLLRKVLPDAVVRPGDPLVQRARHPGVLPAQPAPARAREAAAAQGRRAPAARRATTSTPTSRPATTRGTSGCASSPTATCSRRSRDGTASVVTDHDRHVHRDGHPAAVGRRARGRHHRHRHRPRAAVPRRHRAVGRRRGRRPRRAGSPTRG